MKKPTSILEGLSALCMCVTLITLVMASSSAWSQGTITFGTRTAKETLPFGINALGAGFYTGQYQQIYLGSAFNAPVTITGLAFSQDVQGASVATYHLEIGLGTTTLSPSSPGSAFDPGFTTVFSGTLTPIFTTSNGDFDFYVSTTPYFYNPTNGNLLLNVTIFSAVGDNSAFALDSQNPTMGRILTSGGSTTAYANSGLVTEFTFIPEPSSLALCLCGGWLLTACQLHRRVKKL